VRVAIVAYTQPRDGPSHGCGVIGRVEGAIDAERHHRMVGQGVLDHLVHVVAEGGDDSGKADAGGLHVARALESGDAPREHWPDRGPGKFLDDHVAKQAGGGGDVVRNSPPEAQTLAGGVGPLRPLRLVVDGHVARSEYVDGIVTDHNGQGRCFPYQADRVADVRACEAVQAVVGLVDRVVLRCCRRTLGFVFLTGHGDRGDLGVALQYLVDGLAH